jgi:hypothetical protein
MPLWHYENYRGLNSLTEYRDCHKSWHIIAMDVLCDNYSDTREFNPFRMIEKNHK